MRRESGLEPDDEVDVVVRDGSAAFVAGAGPAGRGKRAVEAFLGKGDVELSTEEILALTRGE